MVKKKVMLSEAIKEYLALMERRKRASSTLRIDQGILDRFQRFTGDIQTQNIHEGHVEKFFYGDNGLMSVHETRQHGRTTNEAISEATHNQYRNRLKVFFSWMAKRDWMTHSMVTACFDKDEGVVPPMDVPAKERQRPQPNILLNILDAAANPRDRVLIAVALNSALRTSEIQRILMGNVNLAEGRIYVVLKKTKSDDHLRIGPDLDRELRAWIEQYEADLGRPLEDDDYLIPTRTGGLINGCYVDQETGKKVFTHAPYFWNPKKSINRTEGIVQSAMAKVGLETRWEGVHTLRRAVALAFFEKIAAEKGDANALQATMALLHHSSVATTERYLGIKAGQRKRDEVLSQPFLTALVSQENVVQFRPRAEGE